MKKWFGFVFALLAVQSPAWAWDVVLTGKITGMYRSNPGNLSLRVNMSGDVSACPYGFGYQNTADGNYNAFSAMMMTAFSLQKTVNLMIVKDSAGWCHVIDFSMAQ